MHEEYVSRTTVVAVVLWGICGLLVAAVWVLAASNAPLRYEIATSVMAVTALTVASVWQVRTYTMRLCALMRVGAGLQHAEADLHPINGKRPR